MNERTIAPRARVTKTLQMKNDLPWAVFGGQCSELLNLVTCMYRIHIASENAEQVDTAMRRMLGYIVLILASQRGSRRRSWYWSDFAKSLLQSRVRVSLPKDGRKERPAITDTRALEEVLDRHIDDLIFHFDSHYSNSRSMNCIISYTDIMSSWNIAEGVVWDILLHSDSLARDIIQEGLEIRAPSHISIDWILIFHY